MYISNLLLVVRSTDHVLTQDQRSAVLRGLSAVFLDEEERTVYLESLQALGLNNHPLLEARLPCDELQAIVKDGLSSLSDEKLLELSKNMTMIRQIVFHLGEECTNCWIGRAKLLLK